MPFPPHTLDGVLPPFSGQPWESAGRSPYPTSMHELVDRYAISRNRCEILAGFIAYREAMRKIGFPPDAFQWLDGSFVDIRSIEPKDIDVVTFYSPPAPHDAASFVREIQAQAPELLPGLGKTAFRVDGYPIELTHPAPTLVGLASYWFGLFSHQRLTFAWRGFLQIELGVEDQLAAQLLLQRSQAFP